MIPDKLTAEFINEHRNDDVRKLALLGARYPGVNIRLAVTQIEGRQLAKSKLPAWSATDGVIYPARLSMEQCSSEETARYKASLIEGESIADLTGGFGIDCSYMAEKMKKGIYIERNSELCDIAAHNFALLGLPHIEIRNGNSEDILPTLPHCDWIFIDPARRDGAGRKVVALSDCEPDVSALCDTLLERANNVMIKCSPMLDITAACRSLRNVKDVHVVAVNNECKELLLILSQQEYETKIECVNLTGAGKQHFSYIQKEESASSVPIAKRLGSYLYEPNAAIQKAGASGTLANHYNIEKLHPNSQLYTSDNLVEEFPGRKFRIEAAGSFSKNDIKVLLNDTRQANITVRNFPETADALRRRLKVADGGDIYLFATTLANNRKVLIKCRKE